MADELDHYRQLLMDDRRETHALAAEARAYLASESDGPAVLNSRGPASITTYPTDKELLELMPETVRDEFSSVVKLSPVSSAWYSIPLHWNMRKRY